jgi:hypothetical protein
VIGPCPLFGSPNNGMAAARQVQQQRRGTTPVLHTPQFKPVLNVEEWEAKAPLSDREVTSVGILKAASETAPFPYKVHAFLCAVQRSLIFLSSIKTSQHLLRDRRRRWDVADWSQGGSVLVARARARPCHRPRRE